MFVVSGLLLFVVFHVLLRVRCVLFGASLFVARCSSFRVRCYMLCLVCVTCCLLSVWSCVDGRWFITVCDLSCVAVVV